jgi:hypothetical protein
MVEDVESFPQPVRKMVLTIAANTKVNKIDFFILDFILS